ncbi:MAG: YihY family inner membrane protein [Gammaproteobacteria bacterium]|nr:YihY/virulence factor BrkB family protein [Gammaproteobacteria bacterium]NIV49666.1 YihY family inner membrane protein [Gammaproteobacteria bacterium]NIW57064.1 YihY family inner membrane protein [Gammaproteobacteria bacterium]
MTDASVVPEPIRSATHFARRVLSRFLANKGLLLASAVSYNTLLSLVPLLAFLLVILSHVYDENWLAKLVLTEFGSLIPGHTDMLSAQVQLFLEKRHLIGWIGFIVLIFFSSWAFRSLDDAFAVIFSHREGSRRLWVSAVIPYAFVTLLGAGLLLQATLVTLLQDLATSRVALIEGHFSASQLHTAMISLFGFFSLALLFTGIYRFMPVAQVRLRHAAVGGLVAATLWELVRGVLLWWFSNVSLVNVVYGSLATIVILLLTLEAAAIIVLLGAQVIAELEPEPREPGLEPG